MKLFKLGQFATVKTGKLYRTAIKDLKADGQAALLQITDINANRVNSPQQWAQVKVDKNDSKFYLTTHDVLIPIRGMNNKAHILTIKHDKPLITNNNVVTIRTDSHQLDPFYLVWYLNSPEVSKYFNSVSEGSNIQKLNSKIIADTPLPLPDRRTQLKIAQIQRNWQQQQTVNEELMKSKSLYYQGICSSLHNNQVATF